MKQPIKLSAKSFALLIASAVACAALAGCGNKGPLVKPSNIPAATPADAEPAEKPATDSTSTPAAEPASGTPAARR